MPIAGLTGDTSQTGQTAGNQRLAVGRLAELETFDKALLRADQIMRKERHHRQVVQNNGHWRMPMSLGGLARGTTVHLNVFARDQFGNESNHTQLKYAVAW